MALLLLLPSASASPAGPAPASLMAGPEPRFVTPVTVPALKVPDPITLANGVSYLLSDIQEKVGEKGSGSFYHYALYLANEKGLESGGEISVDFDPSGQTLIFHKIDLIRDGLRSSRLDPSKISVFRREEGLEDRLLDGIVTAQYVIEDVRVGDIIEYSYTIATVNQVFGKLYDSSIPLGWSMPVERAYFRLLCPRDRKLYFTGHGTDRKPVEREKDGQTEYVLDLAGIPSVLAEDDLPDWYDPYPWVQISETGSWADAAALCVPLYPEPEKISDELAGVIDGIAAANPSPKGRIMEALATVRDHVRYLGLEYGPHSHKPTDPSETYARRFGDCKDKAYLLTTMLHRLGIEAWPALVNVDEGKRVELWHPSPFAFDHVIVLAKAGGKDFWCDPTITAARGDFGHLAQADYGLALVVDKGTKGLTEIQNSGLRATARETGLFFDCSGPEGEPVTLTTTTVYSGQEADDFRDRLLSESRSELENRLLNYYASDYPFIEKAGQQIISDDQERNRITATERFRVGEFFSESEGTSEPEATVYGDEVDAVLSYPRTRVRAMPLSVVYPLHVKQSITVKLGWDAAGKDEEETVRDPAFVFTRRVDAGGRLFRVTYTLITLMDHVPPENVKRHLANVHKVRGLLYCDVPGKGKESPDKDYPLLLLLIIALMIVVLSAVQRRRRARGRAPGSAIHP
ncbi:MAG: DUF3857 domain-containing protein [Thermodesulfobacteriota bacterium]